jgi:2-C-methyl-D-erythritol 4-phosphate cytidylyltransferase
MFRLAELVQALQHALDSSQLVTDEALAMELAGRAPKMIEGHGDNIKITRPEDLRLAELYLAWQV